MLIILLLIALLLLFPFFIISKPKRYQKEAIDYLLVLGCPCEHNGQLSNKQKQRLETCIHYQSITECRHIIISGGAVHNEAIEAEAMAQYLKEQLNACQIETECKARNTFQNFQNTKKLYGKERILIITSAAHCRRAYFFARKFYAHAYVAKASTKDSFCEYLIEYFRLWNVLYWEVRLRLQKKHK